ncbi:MAG: hypothetical protein FVQ85_09220 [Planctomycetes bacterium]|nr:hypothetical protein [Planctomycetota bacterium]
MAKSRSLRKKRSGKKVFLRRLLDFLILAVVVWLAFTLAGRSLRQVAIAQIAELTNAKIKAKSIDFNFDGSVSIEKLVITPKQIREYDHSILKAEKVYARFDIGSLLLVRPRLRKIILKDFVLNAQYDLDAGQWNTTGLKFKAPKGGDGHIPVVRLERGTLQYSKVSNGQVKVVTKVPVDAIFAPAEETPAAYSFSITTAETAQAGKSTLNGTWQPGKITITGGISSEHVPTLQRAWDIKVLAAELSYDTNDIYSLNLKIKDFLSSRTSAGDTFAFDEPSFLESWGAFDTLHRFFKRYRPAGQIDFDLQASGNLDRLRESKLSGKVNCKDVSIQDVNFPYLVEHITGELDFTEKGVSLNNLNGEHNDVDLTFNGWTKSFGENRQYNIRIKSDNMALDNDLYDALNPEQKKFWSAFSPSGAAAIDYTLSRQPQAEKKRSLHLGLLEVDATCEKFPYPLKNLTGDLSFEQDDITISDLVSKYNGRTISLNGRVTKRSTDRPIYELSISAKDVPLDSELAAALPAKQRNIYEQYDMVGLVDAEVKIFTPEPNLGPTSFTAEVSLKEASLQLEKLPLVIGDISAKAVVSPDSIVLEDFTGRYDGASISLAGRIWPTDQNEQPRFCLTVRAEQMELNDDLIELLPGSLGQYVSKLQPKGKINLTADLNKAGPEDCHDHKLTIDCLGNSLSWSFAKETPGAGGVNFKPAPYPLKDLTGRLVITADSIKLENITAAAANDTHATANTPIIKLNGEIKLTDNAFSSGRFALSASDVLLDERLGLTLPEDLRDLYVKLAPQGRYDLNMEDIKVFNADDGQRNIDFAGTAKLKTCNLNIWPTVGELDAVLVIKGIYKTGGGFSDSRVTVIAESLKVSGKKITALKADMNYDRSRKSWLTENLIADCYGGKLTGKLEFKQPDRGPSEYLLQVGFVDIDLAQFLSGQVDQSGAMRQESQFDRNTSGKMSGSLSLSTAVGRSSSRIGRCRLTITDMHVGKLSPLARLLYVLNLTEPKDSIFERMLIDSYIKNGRVLFEKFDLAGQAIAFSGSGFMDLKTRDVDLTLTARGKRLADAEPSVLQSLAEGLGGGIVRMEVTGNAYDPKIEIKTLPVIKDSLTIFGKRPNTPD